MRHMVVRCVLLVSAVLVLPGAVRASDNSAITRAKAAIESGNVVPERDLAPLIEALRRARDVDDQKELVEAVSDLGAGSGSSPANAKRYLLEKATPLLLALAKTGGDAFLKGDALFALRDMGASRAVLEQAAAIAEADPDAYVQSRGEILRNFIASMPAESTASAIRPADAGRERHGLAYLKEHGLGASPDQLRRSAQGGDAAAVQALLDAGVDVNGGGGGLGRTPLYSAVFSGCGASSGETDALLDTVKVLLAGGADARMTGDNGNTILLSAAQMCGPRMVAALAAAGADVNARNGSGMTPLVMALIMQKVDAAEALVAKGARLTAQDVQMVQGSATNPRARALIKKASGS
jgi:hypothetical protein